MVSECGNGIPQWKCHLKTKHTILRQMHMHNGHFKGQDANKPQKFWEVFILHSNSPFRNVSREIPYSSKHGLNVSSYTRMATDLGLL